MMTSERRRDSGIGRTNSDSGTQTPYIGSAPLHVNETRRLLSSNEDSPPPFPGDPVPSGSRGRNVQSPGKVFRSRTSTVHAVSRSVSDERLSGHDNVFVSYLPTSTTSMILPTTNDSFTSTETHHFPASSPNSLSGSRFHSTDSLPIRTFSFRSGSKKLSRRSTRRSLGREWTSKHWTKVKEIEENSEKAKRCSKLSSGFAPLMIFGGLVFLCIGVSALTNNGKDQNKLKSLSTAPIIMGIFMLILGWILIISWIGCRTRSKALEKQLIHGSRQNSEISGNLIHALLTKLSSPSRRTAPSPSLPGVTLDGIDILKSQSDSEVRASMPSHRSVQSRDNRMYMPNALPRIGNGEICTV